MGRFLEIVKRCLFPGWRWGLALALVSAAGLFWVFSRGLEGTAVSYAVYPLSAYALTVVAAAAVRACRTVWRRLQEAVPLVARWRRDDYFRVRLGLVLSFLVNLCYAGFRVVCAVLYASFWDGALGFYYILLCAARLFLFRRTPGAQGRTDYRRELQVCRWTGCYLMALNLALLWISVQIIREGRSYDYPGTLIYAAAAYSFYCLTLAVYNAVKYRKFRSPVLTAAKAVSLTTALVSILSLETAMLAQFGGDPGFQLLMTTATAAAVCSLVLVIAVFLVVSAGRKLKQP